MATPAAHVSPSLLDDSLHFAAAKGDCYRVSEFLALKADPASYTTRGLTAIMLATDRSQLEVVQLLLAAKVEPTQRDKHGSPVSCGRAQPDRDHGDAR